MINQARTLLLNQPSTRFTAEMPGYEIIPDDFHPTEFDNATRLFHQALFLGSREPVFLLHRVSRLLSILHGSRAESALAGFDARRTYGQGEQSFWLTPEGWTIVQLAENGASLNVFGQQSADMKVGRAEWTWRVRVIDSDEVEVLSIGLSPDPTAVAVTAGDGVTNAFPLPGSDLLARIHFTSTLLPGNGWSVVHRAWPRDSLATLEAQLLEIGSEAVTSLFRSGTAAGQIEPWPSLRGLKEQHPDATERVAAMLTAFLLASMELR
jgi:hypothetical protein